VNGIFFIGTIDFSVAKYPFFLIVLLLDVTIIINYYYYYQHKTKTIFWG